MQLRTLHVVSRTALRQPWHILRITLSNTNNKVDPQTTVRERAWLRMTSGIVLLNLETILKEEELARRELDEESLDPLCVDDHSDDAKREE